MNQLISSVSASSLTIISVSGNYYVQILYQDGVDAERVELQLPGCAMLCPLDQLIHNSKSMAVKSQQEFESLCIKDDKPWRKDLTPLKKLYFLLRRFSTTDYLRCTALLLSSLLSSFTINKVQNIFIE